jgi:hypothetical protein
VSVLVHVNTHEALWVSRVTGIPMSDLTTHVHGDTVEVGDIEIELLHTRATPRAASASCSTGGWSPGTPCSWTAAGAPTSRRRRRRDVPQPAAAGRAVRGSDGVPGHWYSIEPSAALSEVKRSNYVYKVSNLEQWHALMGG